MSSYEFETHEQGPPSREGELVAPVFEDGRSNCGKGEWVCEHRRALLVGAVQFRKAVAGAEQVTNWWTNGSNQIAFGRDNKGFVAINLSDQNLQVELPTSLPAGTYCDRLSTEECFEVNVLAQGNVSLDIPPLDAIAIDVLSKK